MNIVKGVADLIRRTSSGQNEDSASGSQAQRFCPPGPRIRFRYYAILGPFQVVWLLLINRLLIMTQ